VYYQHFGLNGPPFQFTPSPAMLYMSQTHREGMAALEWGLMYESTGFSLLVGESGTGKTTLIAALLSRQYQRLNLAYVTNPRLGFDDILRLILTQIGVEGAGLSKSEMLDRLGAFLGGLRPGERLVVIFDEAQGLSDEALEELRLLSNYGRPGENQLQLILAGQPELLRRLMVPHLRQFNERIGARTLLMRLDPSETVEYIDYRLRARNGSAAKIFHRKALKYIVSRSGGVPRRINVLCHNSMLLAYAAGAKQVSYKMAREAVADYEDLFSSSQRAAGDANSVASARLARLTARPAAFAVAASIVAVVLVLLGAYFGGSMRPALDQPVEAREQVAQDPPKPAEPITSTPAAAKPAQSPSTTPIVLPEKGSAKDTAAPVQAAKPRTKSRTVFRLARKRPADQIDDEGDE
jgi:general secretion pathway protein A